MGYEPREGVDPKQQARDASEASLTALVGRAERLSETASFATRQLDEVRKQADQARSILGESLNNWSTLIDEVMEHQERLRALLRESEQMADETGREMDERLSAIRAAAEEAVEQVAPLAEKIKSDLGTLLSRAEETRAEVKGDLRGGMLSLAEALRAVAERAEEAADHG